MHAVLFGLKRAHQSTLRIARPMLAKLELTAARFDLLYVLMLARSPMLQSKLQRKLGVTRATVSRMLKSLEGLGFVERRGDEYDHRRKRAALTARGRERIVMAHKELVRSGWIQLAIDSALGANGRPASWCNGPCYREMSTLVELLAALRKGFYDTGDVYYPMSPMGEFNEDGPVVHEWHDGEGVV